MTENKDVLTTNKINEKLESIYNKLYEWLQDKDSKVTSQFIDDLTAFQYICNDKKYDFVIVAFWEYFKKKYEIENIDKYFGSTLETIQIFHYYVLSPLDRALDFVAIQDLNMRAKVSAFYGKIKFKLRIWLKHWILSIVSPIIMSIAFIISYYFRDNEIWWSDFLLAIGTGFLIAIMITSINRRVKYYAVIARIRKTKLEASYKAYKKEFDEDFIRFRELDEKNIKSLIMTFCDINNTLERHIRSIEKIKGIDSIEEYHILKKFEKEIFEFSSSKMRKSQEVENFSDISNEDINQLKIYVLRLEQILNEYFMNLRNFIMTHEIDSKLLEEKIIS